MSTFVLNRNYQLQLPTNFVEVDSEEMEYIDGGWTKNDAKMAVYGVIASAVGTIAKKAISRSLIGAAINASAAWVAAGIDTAIIAAYVHPGIAIAIGGATVAAIYATGHKLRYW